VSVACFFFFLPHVCTKISAQTSLFSFFLTEINRNTNKEKKKKRKREILTFETCSI
jgi:G:T-mismatch repair DNA endonuclease (very short patch repair protein)